MKPNIIPKLQHRLTLPLPFANQAHEFVRRIPNDLSHRNPRICAVLLAIFPLENDFAIPFMLRPDDGHVHSGQISFPGGGIEESDKNLADTALRETQEEIGLTVSSSALIGTLSDIYIPPSNSLVTPYVAFLSKKPNQYKPDPKEVDKIPELKISDFLNPKNYAIHPVQLPDGTSIKFPAYNIGEYHVWGATARIMKELLLLWKEVE